MAERLLKYYKYIGDQKGMAAKIQLAQLTRMPSARAAMEPDHPETVALFKKMVAQITGRPAPDL